MPSIDALLSPESLSAAGRGAEKLSLPSLQSKMKCDPDGYEAELLLLYRHFESSLHLFRHESSLRPSSDPTVAKELGDLTMFLAHATPFYPDRLAGFPRQVVDLLRADARSLPSSLRCHLAQALILLINRNTLGMEETLELFMDLQTLGDRTLKKLAFSHVVHSIRRMNQKHKNEANNRKLQNILFAMLQGEEEQRAKRSLVILCDLHRRRVWFDDRTANAICNACFHSSSKILVAALSFLLGYERIENDDSEASSSDDEDATQQAQVVLSREVVYKAHNKGTAASKKKKKAKLQRVVRNMKRQQRIASQNNSSNYYSPLTHLKDAQGFVEKLFSHLQKCNERFEVRMMMLKLIARAVGLHRLILLNFYPYMQKYAQPHQRNVTELLAAAVQACHDMVPPDAVEPLFRQIVNQFVHDRSRSEAIAVGLNVVREICMRMPLLMNEDLLQDLVLYKKSHEKAVSTAARSLITLFREICPSLLVKKDRGRPIDPKARPKAFGEVSVNTNVPGIELLEEDDESVSESEEEASASGSEGVTMESSTPCIDSDSEANGEEDGSSSEGDVEEDEVSENDEEEDEEVQEESSENDDSIDGSDDNDNTDIDSDENLDSDSDDDKQEKKPESRKRKLGNFVGELDTANSSLRALKKLAGSTMAQQSSDEILSNEDFKRIKELKTKKEAKLVMGQQGLLNKGSNSNSASYKILSSEEIATKRVDPAKLEINIKRKLSKEQRLQMVKAGREDRGKYQARTAVKQKKTGGLSNRQKEHKKLMPMAAKRMKVARSRQEKKKQQKRSRKQFLGKKAWK